jgi:uncharacterized membrane protein
MSVRPSQVGADLDRNVIVFGLALIAAFLLATVVPDLIPARARTGLATFAHARILSVEAAPQGDGSSLLGDQPPPDASFPPDASGGAGSGDGAPAVAPPQATVLFLDGPFQGNEGRGPVQGPSGALELPDYRPGDEVVVQIDTAADGTLSMEVVDRWRMPFFLTLCGITAVLAAAVAGWRGLRAIASLALTLVIAVRLFIPLVIDGWDAVALAVVFGVVVTVLSFMLTQGVDRVTVAAILGTSIGLGAMAVLAVIVNAAASFTPAQGSDEVIYLRQVTNGAIDLSGLFLAAIILAGLGVLNDVAMSQAATADELRRADPSLSRRDLFRRTMNVGTAHLAATINTLVLVYLGTALPLVVLLVLLASNLDSAISLENVAVEVTRMLVGVIGILAAVPVTTAIAVRLMPDPVRRSSPDERTSDELVREPDALPTAAE